MAGSSIDGIEKELLEDIDRLKNGDGCLRAGMPYFDGVYGRDALVAGWQLLERDPGIARDTLRFLAKHQGTRVSYRTGEEPGKILHVFDYVPRGPLHMLAKVVQGLVQGFPYYGSIDVTPLFVIVAGETLLETKDEALLGELWPNVVKAMEWMARFGDPDGDGFLEYDRRNPFGLRNQSWKDTAVYLPMKAPVAAVEVQGYAYKAYATAAALAGKVGKDGSGWSARAERLRERFRRSFWMDDSRFFALALDGSKRQVKEIGSNSGHLLFTGILGRDETDMVVSRLFQPDMLTDYGLRTHSVLSPHFRKSCTLGAIWPHDNWLVWIGLKQCGYLEQADRLKAALLKARRELGHLPEFYDVFDGKIKVVPRIWGRIGWPCRLQAWSSGALLNMLQDGR